MTVATQAQPRRRRTRRADIYAPLDWLLVRAPLLPVESYLALDPKEKDVPRDPRVLAALAVGAGDLLGGLERAGGNAGRDPKLWRKLQRYLIRMSTRPTPYGLFAAVGLARPGSSTDLAISSAAAATRTRPDMAWLMSLVSELEQRPEVRRQLRFRANTAARLAAGRVFLAERAVTGHVGHTGEAVSIRATGAVQRVLALARAPCSWERLAQELLATPGATPDRVERLLNELWSQTLLLSELRPPLTGDPARYVAERLRGIPAARDVSVRLDALLEQFAAWDALPPREKASGYASLVARARELHPGPESPALQVDAALALAGRRIATEVVEEAARAAELLVRLNPAGAGSALAGYRQAFEGRYGPELEVPLLELLDPEAGLGPPSTRDWTAEADPERAARRDALLWELALEALRDRRPELELDEELLEALQVASPAPGTLPVSLDLAVFVLADSPGSVDAGDFRLLVGPNLGGQEAGRNLGRFADLLGPDAGQALRSAAAADDLRRPQELAVELVYLPARARSANVAIRPAVRAHEIVLGTTPGVADGQVIPLDELVVGLRAGRFYLRWPRRDRYVRVRAGHMLNSVQAPAVCRFLEDVGRDGSVPLTTFDWGSAGRLPYLPRVRRGRLILEPSRWRIDAAMRDRELPSESAAGFPAALSRWRKAWSVPPRVYLSVGDNRLLLNLNDPEQLEQLREELRHIDERGPVVLQEPLPGAETAWLPGADGHYVTELVVPLVLREAPDGESNHEALAPASGPIRAAAPTARLRPPGSDWLFLKLYCPRAVEDELIAGPVRSLGGFTTAAGLAAEWFFLRYADPDPHLRLRFRGDPDMLLSRLLPQLCGWASELVEDGRCARFGFDTYDREVERYGGEEATAVAESVFAADSRAVAELLHLSTGAVGAIDRTTLAVLSIDDLLAGLGLDERERLAWYREAVTARHESGDEYRKRGRELRRRLTDAAGAAGGAEDEALGQVLAERRAALAPLAERLEALDCGGRLDRSRHELCRSHVHLHYNRLLGSGPALESMLLGLLLRTREGLDRAPMPATR